MRLIPLFLAALFIGCDGADKDPDVVDTDTDVSTSDADGDGYTAESGDCDDDNASVYPGADEIWYDGVDQNCDLKDDYDQDEDGVGQADDCDDLDALVFPGAEDVCDEIDNDCDGELDEGGDLTAYADTDGDGYGTGDALGTYCELPVGTASNADDCDDTNLAVNPTAEEICDGLDNNCDAEIDAGATDGHVVYADADADGFGDASTGVSVCGDIPGTVEDATDCNDGDVLTFPGAVEVCDLADNDCDGEADEGSPDARTYYLDADLDGYGDPAVTAAACGAPAGYVEAGTDCNDADSALSPGALELCDGIDNDCDAEVDTDATDALTLYADADVDGYGDPATELKSCAAVEGYVADGTDCDDADGAANPAGVEVCDGLDNNCDSAVDEATAADAPTWYVDADVDGYGDPSGTAASCDQPLGFVAADTDCNDTDGSVNPGAIEVCDAVDQDCDGTADDDSADAVTWYGDVDGDGYGDVLGAMAACDAPTGYVADDSDCNDADVFSYPGADEICDGADQDCDGAIDNDPVDGLTLFADADADGFGNPGSSAVACSEGDGWVADATDCDDATGAVNPGATEVCDAFDNDCDGSTDEAGSVGEGTWYLDGDGDGYGTSEGTMDACDMPSGYAGTDDDCDDATAASNPGATEADDGLDNDCDGLVDEGFVGPGDVIITEITRQPRFGSSSINTNGAWFELYNTTDADIDLSGWYVQRLSSTLAADGFYVDPDESVTIAAGDYAVFCKTDNFTSASTIYSFMDPCDYYWGDEAASASYAGTYRDNTFNMQRDEDMVSLYSGGDASTGTLIDAVHWYYDATNGYWPRDASRSMQLDLSSYDGDTNDSVDAWCSTTNNGEFDWYLQSATSREFGTPGLNNHTCP